MLYCHTCAAIVVVSLSANVRVTRSRDGAPLRYGGRRFHPSPGSPPRKYYRPCFFVYFFFSTFPPPPSRSDLPPGIDGYRVPVAPLQCTVFVTTARQGEKVGKKKIYIFTTKFQSRKTRRTRNGGTQPVSGRNFETGGKYGPYDKRNY